jgi:esterase/lipase superfamily enzyme
MWQREVHTWESEALDGRAMEVIVHGHAGARVLVFPTSQGTNHEWEDRGMFAAVSDRIAAGEFQFWCVPSVDALSWYNGAATPHLRAEWQARYDAYLLEELLPFSGDLNDNPFIITTGASFGGYHAINFGLRHPELVGRILSMSGLADIRRFTGGVSDDLIYFHNPVEFMRLEHDPGRLAAFRRMDIILAVGRDDTLCAGNQALSATLWDLGIGNALRLWDGWAHDWPYWQSMLTRYLGGHD